MTSSKIKVLLIDDKPTEWTSKNGKLVDIFDSAKFGEIPLPELNDFFEVAWLQSPYDGKEFRNMSMDIENRFSPEKLNEIGFVPDIICFDYALSGAMGQNIMDIDIEQVNPNYRLHKFLYNEKYQRKATERSDLQSLKGFSLDKMTINNDSKIQDKKFIPPATGRKSNEDNMGCFIGGLIFSFFKNQPCGAIPTTRKDRLATVDGEAIFLSG